MNIGEAALMVVEPRDDELVELLWTGDMAKAFVALLNMNKIIDGRGRRIVFRWLRFSIGWKLEEEVRYD